jgi:hypothetical protein
VLPDVYTVAITRSPAIAASASGPGPSNLSSGPAASHGRRSCGSSASVSCSSATTPAPRRSARTVSGAAFGGNATAWPACHAASAATATR